ncbi:MAG: PaaI family thioesterase [Burkholderiaceae bacterium]
MAKTRTLDSTEVPILEARALAVGGGLAVLVPFRRRARMGAIQLTAEHFRSQRLPGGFPFPPISKMLEPRFEHHDIEQQILRLSFMPRDDWGNPGGAVQGGMISAMLDDATGPLIIASTAGTLFPASTDFHTMFYSAVPLGMRCFVQARIDKLGRSVAFTSASLMDEAGKTYARAVHTAQLMPIRLPKEN